MIAGRGEWLTIFALMEHVRDQVIEFAQIEVANLVPKDPRFGKILIRKESDKSHVPPEDRTGISVYIGVRRAENGTGSIFSDGFELIVKIRISDHEPSQDFIWLDISDKIWVRGSSGVRFKWSELDHDVQKMLYPVGGSIVTDKITIDNARYSISPSDQGEVVRKCVRKLIDSIHEFFGGTFDPSIGEKL